MRPCQFRPGGPGRPELLARTSRSSIRCSGSGSAGSARVLTRSLVLVLDLAEVQAALHVLGLLLGNVQVLDALLGLWFALGLGLVAFALLGHHGLLTCRTAGGHSRARRSTSASGPATCC